MAPRWRKVLSDLSSNKIRTVLVVASIGIGVFAVGLVSMMYSILMNDLNAVYLASNPHSATLYTAPFDDDLLETVRRMPGIGAVQGRSSTVVTLLLKNGRRVQMSVQAIPALDEIKMDQLTPLNPLRPEALEDRQIFLERSISAVADLRPGDLIEVEYGQSKTRSLKVAGIVHDVGSMPYMFTNQISGYVNLNTIELLGGTRRYTDLNLLVAEQRQDETHVREVANQVKEKLEKGGQPVYFTMVYKPGEHPANSVIQAVLGLLGALGSLAVFLSGFLVVNTINALLSQHTRQIGIMKAIGANNGQITSMYLLLVLLFGLLAFVLAAPVAVYSGYLAARGMGGLLNFELLGFRIPPLVLYLQLSVALAVPLISALGPVFLGTRVTVREALSTYGLSTPPRRPTPGERRWATIQNAITGFFSRPLLISLRNTFRRKARLLLTLSTLTLGGAIFIAIFNVQNSLTVEVNKTLGYFLSDINLSLSRPYRSAQIAPMIKNIPGIVSVEGWGFSTARLEATSSVSAVECIIIAPPAESTLIQPTLSGGRWLIPQDENALVIGNHLLAKRPDLKIGDPITLKINNKDTSWKIVGSYLMAGNTINPILYANREYLARLQNDVDRTTEFRLVTNPNDTANQTRLAEALKTLLKTNGIQVSQVQTGAEIREMQAASINILIYLLLAMALLIAVVGGLGLMGTMSMNVLERTREIGVMRAIGAGDGAILRLVLIEGILIGLISWGLGTVMAIPISEGLGNLVGYAMMNMPMHTTFSFTGFILWFIVVLFLSALASFLPARNASRLTIREILAYE